MGYFYSETQPGSVSLETCSVYFTYRPEEGSSSSLQSMSSYERLQRQEEQQEQPLSPDSGFGMGGEGEEGGEEYTEQSEMEDEGMKEECSGINVQHLVSFVLSLPGIITPAEAAHMPLGLAQEPDLSPWSEDTEIAAVSTSEALGGSAVRPSSMVVQPCSSGYLTLKEMQKYSNKSI